MLDLHFQSELRRGKGEQEERSRAILPISFAFTVEEFPCCGIKKTEQGLAVQTREPDFETQPHVESLVSWNHTDGSTLLRTGTMAKDLTVVLSVYIR